MVRCIFVVLMQVFCFHVNAREGFNTIGSSTPEFLKANFPSVALVVVNNQFIATSFLIKKTRNKDTTELYFLTNNHIVNKSCELNKNCSAINFFLNPPKVDENEFSNLTGDLRYQSMVLIKASSDPDLALIKISTTNTGLESVKPVKISRHCDLKIGEPVYLVGFPATEKRTNSNRLPIVDQSLLLRRWSVGIFVENLIANGPTGAASTRSIMTTVDGINGNSGGPLFNSSGEVVGVHEASVSRISQGYPYTGDESVDHLQWHSSAVGCAQIRRFLEMPDLL